MGDVLYLTGKLWHFFFLSNFTDFVFLLAFRKVKALCKSDFGLFHPYLISSDGFIQSFSLYLVNTRSPLSLLDLLTNQTNLLLVLKPLNPSVPALG